VLTPAALNSSRAIRETIVLAELQHVRVQYRLVAALLAGSMIFGLLDPALLLLGTEESLVYKAAAVTTIGPSALGHVLIGLSALLVPYMLVQISGATQRVRGATQLACVSLALSALVWLFLAWRCIPLDLGGAPLVFTRYGLGCLLFALALAWSLNAEQLRIAMERCP
jgi:hypothetical protein